MRRISLKVAAPTDARSVASKTFHFCFIGVAGQSLLPPTRGRWRAFSITAFHGYCRFPDEKSFTALPVRATESATHNFPIICLNRIAIIAFPSPFRAPTIPLTETQGGARRLACRWAGIHIPFGEKTLAISTRNDPLDWLLVAQALSEDDSHCHPGFATRCLCRHPPLSP